MCGKRGKVNRRPHSQSCSLKKIYWFQALSPSWFDPRPYVQPLASHDPMRWSTKNMKIKWNKIQYYYSCIITIISVNNNSSTLKCIYIVCILDMHNCQPVQTQYMNIHYYILEIFCACDCILIIIRLWIYLERLNKRSRFRVVGHKSTQFTLRFEWKWKHIYNPISVSRSRQRSHSMSIQCRSINPASANRWATGRFNTTICNGNFNVCLISTRRPFTAPSPWFMISSPQHQRRNVTHSATSALPPTSAGGFNTLFRHFVATDAHFIYPIRFLFRDL